MSLMLTTATARSSASAPLMRFSAALTLRLAARANQPTLRSSVCPPLAVPFSSSASSSRSLPLPRRVSSTSGSAVTAASAHSAAATPRADRSQSAEQSRSFSTKQVGSPVASPSSSSLFRRSAHSSASLRSAHLSATAFAQAARGQLGARAFSSKSDATSSSSRDASSLSDLERRLNQQAEELKGLHRLLAEERAQSECASKAGSSSSCGSSSRGSCGSLLNKHPVQAALIEVTLIVVVGAVCIVAIIYGE